MPSGRPVALSCVVSGTLRWLPTGIADIRNGSRQAVLGRLERPKANEERRRARAKRDCADRWEDAAEEWAEPPRRSLDGTPEPHDVAADRQAYLRLAARPVTNGDITDGEVPPGHPGRRRPCPPRTGNETGAVWPLWPKGIGAVAA